MGALLYSTQVFRVHSVHMTIFAITWESALFHIRPDSCVHIHASILAEEPRNRSPWDLAFKLQSSVCFPDVARPNGSWILPLSHNYSCCNTHNEIVRTKQQSRKPSWSVKTFVETYKFCDQVPCIIQRWKKENGLWFRTETEAKLKHKIIIVKITVGCWLSCLDKVQNIQFSNPTP